MDGDTYERTYSVSRPSVADDYAIACALAEDAPPPRPDVSLDHSLALQLHEKEVEKLVRPPSQTRHTHSHRHDHSLRSLLRTLNITKVIPRINPCAHPTASYVSQDRQRLLLRLDMYALQERQVTGDGNCQFRAIADQLYSRQDQHAAVRQAVVEQLCKHPELYKDYVTTDYQQYVSSMSTLGTWGDHVTLQAAANAFHVRICIISSFLDDCVISIHPTSPDEQQQQQQVQPEQQQLEQQLEQQQGLPGQQQPLASCADGDHTQKTVWLAFWAEVHYNSLAAKAPESPSLSTSSEDETNSTGSCGSAEGSSAKRGKLLGSKRLKRAADAVVPSMLRHS